MSSSCYFYLLLLMSFFHLCLSTKNFNHVLCKDEERQALLQFKRGLIDHADQLASWVDEEKECCSWAGIVCDNFTGHVHQIRLRGVDEQDLKQSLGGDLSPSLLHLKQLRHLDLSCNDFGGIQVPSFIGSLRNFKYLNLSNSRFGGIIPPQLGNLSELQVLGLGSFYDPSYELTRLLNMQWLSSLHMLHHLDMSGMNLSQAIDWFQVINTLPSLTQLHLSFCQLSHAHPHVSSLNITSLSLIDLSFNYHFSNIPMPRWILGITSLVSLDLSECYFQGLPHSSIDSFRNLTSLKLLDVSGNNFMSSSSVLKGLSSATGSNLISLDISSCLISNSQLVALHNLTSLLSLDLSYNQLTKPIPKSLGNLCNLREIDLSGNTFQNNTLTYLLESFFECKSPSLESLFLESLELSGNIPAQLGQLIHLVNLDLAHNMIVGIIPDSIGGLSFLEMLDLSDNQLNGSLPVSLGQLSKLNSLHLENNQLNGVLPHSLGQLSKLKTLDISSNLLTGVVTEAHFVNLTELKYLNGKGNNLIFRTKLANWIPPFQLEALYLNSWNLGPQFPMWLQSQRDLVHFDISNTSISAPFPHLFWRSFPPLNYLDMSQSIEELYIRVHLDAYMI